MIKIQASKSARIKTHLILLSKEQSKKIKEFSGDNKEVVVLYCPTATKIHVGLGDEKKVTLESVRHAVALAVSEAQKIKKENVSLLVPDLKSIDVSDMTKAVTEALILKNYCFDKYKTDKGSSKALKSVDLVGAKVASADITYAQTIAEGTSYTRDLVNEMAHVVTPAYLADQAKEMVKAHKECKVTIFDEKKIAKEGMGLLQAVGQGGPYPPRLIILEYKGNPDSKKVRAVVGKGITFDTGGLNLKPSGSIETMRYDMAGAATTLGLFKTVVALGLKVNVVCAVAAAYNAIGGDAYFPGDIYRSYSGKTVQIKNTDAEGRLILADALTYVSETYKPTEMVNLATLTGAILVSFGSIVAGLFANNDDLAESLFQAGEQTHERLWRLPLYQEYSDAMKGDLADLNNLSNLGRGHAGSITAATFLQEFVGKTAWAHLDIAGVANNDGEAKGYVPKHATGFGVRLLSQWLETHASAS